MSFEFDGSKIVEAAKEFGRGFVHGSIEQPLNGIIDLGRCTADRHVPVIDIVEDPKQSPNIGTRMVGEGLKPIVDFDRKLVDLYLGAVKRNESMRKN